MVLVLALGAFAVSVNTIQVEGAAYLRAQPTLEKGRPNGLRGIFQYSPTGEALQPQSIDLALIDAGSNNANSNDADSDGAPADGLESHPLKQVASDATQAWPDLSFMVPDDVPAGDYELRFRVTHDKVNELTDQVPVQVLDAPSRPTSIREMTWPRAKPRTDDADDRRPSIRHRRGDANLGLALIPASSEVLRGHEQTFYLRAFDSRRGKPLSATIDLHKTDGMHDGKLPDEVRTDDQGFASFTMSPVTDLRFDATLRVDGDDHDSDDGSSNDAADDSAEDATGENGPSATYAITLYTVTSQLTFDQLPPVAIAGEPIQGALQSILDDNHYMVDLFDGDHLLHTLTARLEDHRGGLRFEAPSADQTAPLLRLQTYRSLYGLDHGWDATYLLLLAEDSAAARRQALADLFEWLAHHRDDPHYAYLATDDGALAGLSQTQLQELIAAALADVPKTLVEPPVLINTRQDDIAELETWRQQMRHRVMIMMSILLVLGLAVVLYFIATGIAHQQRGAAQLRAIELEFEDPDPTTQRRLQFIERSLVILQATIVFGMMVAFAVGIVVVISIL